MGYHIPVPEFSGEISLSETDLPINSMSICISAECPNHIQGLALTRWRIFLRALVPLFYIFNDWLKLKVLFCTSYLENAFP
jgi:hypothetical protein